MDTRGGKLTYANVAATLALVIATAGGAYAIKVDGGDVENGTLTGKDIKKNSVPEGDLNFNALRPSDTLLDGEDTMDAPNVSGDQAGYQTILTNTFELEKRADVLAFASASIENTGAAPADVSFQILLDGELHHQFNIADSLSQGEDEMESFSLQCNLVPVGEHDLELQVNSGGSPLNIGGASLNLVSMQDIH